MTDKPSVLPGAEPAWWLREAPPDDEAPPLEGELAVDVAIVGGGYTGLWTALALRERAPELEVAVLEAEFCGWGPSGRNGGFLHGYWSYLPTLVELFGRERALELCAAGDRIVPAVRAFLEARGEDAWLSEGGMLKVSTTPAQDASVDAAVAAARAAGRPEEAEPVEEPGISPVFRRGVFYRDGATVHPGRLVRALRRAALDAGVRLHEHTRVTGIGPGRLVAGRGSVRARELVVATNAAATDWRPIRGRMTVFGSYVVLTEPVPELLEEIGWTGGEAIVDARMFLHYFRTTADGRVLMGSGSGPIGRGNRIDQRFTHDAATAARAERGLRRLLPGLAGARVEAAWGGPIDVSADHLPFAGTVPNAADPLRDGLLRPRRRPVVAARAGARLARPWPPTTSGRGCRSCGGRSPPCRRSRSAGSAAGRSGRRSWPARRPTSRAGARRCPPGSAPGCRARSDCVSDSAENRGFRRSDRSRLTKCAATV